MSFFSWVEDAAGACGRALGEVTDAIADGINAVSDLVGKIPIIGGVFHGILSIVASPFEAMDALIEGKRLDDVVLGEFKDIVSGIRDIAPLAQSIISFVPGIGQGLSGAIGGAIALANGANISDALVVAIKDALPGGPIAAAALEATESAVRGENVFESVGQAVLHQLPKEAQEALTVIYKATQGENVLDSIAMAALDDLRGYLPDYAKIGVDIGLAVGQGRNLQQAIYTEIVTMGPEKLSGIAEMGIGVIETNPTFNAGAAIFKNTINAGTQAANTALALLKQNVGLIQDNPYLVQAINGARGVKQLSDTIRADPNMSRTCAAAPNFPGCYDYGLGEVGYTTGVAIMSKYGLNETMIAKMRAKLGPTDIITFDAAVSMYVGNVMKPPNAAEVASLTATIVIDSSVPLSSPASSIPGRLNIVRNKLNPNDPSIRWGIVKEKIRGQSPTGSLYILRSLIRQSPSAEITTLTSRLRGLPNGYQPTNLDIGRATYYTIHGMKKADPSQRVNIVKPMSFDDMAHMVAVDVMKQIKSTQGLTGLWNEMINFISHNIYHTA